MKRREAREHFMQLLFQMDVKRDFSKAVMDQFLEQYVEDRSQQAYFEHMQEVVEQRLPEIDRRLEEAADNWKISRFAKVDLAVLRLSVAEIFYFDEIPAPVAANEAVELAKKFGGEDSGKFVNGILGKVTRGKEDGERPHSGD